MKKAVYLLTMLTLLLATSMNVAAPPEGKGGGKGGGGGDGNDGGGTSAPPYTITLLGTLGGNSSSATGMNNHGDVIGLSETEVIAGRTWQHAFLNVDDGAGGRLMIDLQDLFEFEELIPVFDYENVLGFLVTEANDINDDGQIVGVITEITENEILRRGFRYTPGDATALPQLENLGEVAPSAINSYGDVTGHLLTSDDGLTHAFVWTDVDGIGLIDLGAWDGRNTFGTDINDDMQVCGHNGTWDRAWRFTFGPGYEDLGTLFPKKRDAISAAFGINNSGQVVGESNNGRWTNRVFRHTDNEELIDLGTLGGDNSYGASINTNGDVVGDSETGNGKRHLFLYTDTSGLVDLEAAIENLPADLDGYLRSGVTINDGGQVSGRAGDGTGNQTSLNGHTYEAYLLSPNP